MRRVTDRQRRWLLCGGIGSGKTIVRELLAKEGMNTLDADSIGHEVLEPGGAAFGEVAARWPSAVIDGRIDRSVLAGIVFTDSEELARLEAVTHPHIFGIINDRVERFEGPVIVEMPVLGQGLGDGWRRLVVDGSDQVRARRAVDRGMAPQDVARRMAAQPTRQQWLAVADMVIPNEGDLEDLKETVDRVIPHL